ncbi:ABC-2 type transport system permease protein [Actinomadura pelletieri DSM 43383]|uniref:ABC-2 type transport system permease protein n=1 Tax=Actinomadura pelletieri DSM 43383 TaxID=1120940 RepID=A0A495QGV5_9ACTN|nr:ABC transporter permease [Actinomadura pelletieri]RKS71142.1 ABC-2 type transport system permease protein [Actinomadura pelletieri DSM 43383]
MTVTPIGADAELRPPGNDGGLRQTFRNRYLMRLLVRRELRARYKGSLLGLGWSYVRPAVHFAVYYYVIGVFLGMDTQIEHFAVYLFSGMVLINLFTETLHSATRSVTNNAALVRKVFLPRELFPTASALVSLVHFLPGMTILLGATVATGWRPSPQALAAAVCGFAIIAVLGLGLGLLCAAVNVFVRDLEQGVDIAMIVITWSAPMIYPWTHVREHAPGWVLDVYLANPLVSAVSLFQRAFWFPGTGGGFTFPPDLYVRAGVSMAVSILVFATGRAAFARMQKRFAQEL